MFLIIRQYEALKVSTPWDLFAYYATYCVAEKSLRPMETVARKLLICWRRPLFGGCGNMSIPTRMALPTKIIIVVAYITAIVSTVYFWDEERRRDIFSAFLPRWQLEMNMALFPFVSPILLVVLGLFLSSLFNAQ